LLSLYELFIIQKPPVFYDCTADHMLNLVEYPGADFGWLHWKIV